MKSISDPFLRRPVLTLVVSLLVLLIGLVCLPLLQVENLPPIAPGRVTVRATYPGAGPEVVEQGVTALLEQQLNGLERLDSIRSTSSANGSSITLGFEGGDPELNQINTQNEVAVITRQLPAPVARFGVQVRRSSDDLLMVLSFSADPKLYGETFLSGWLDQVVKERLQRVPGVGNVTLSGGNSLAFRLWLNPAQLEERGLTIAEVRAALQQQNVLAALGQTGEAPSPSGQELTLPLRMEGRLRSPAEFEQLVVARSANGGVTLLRDVGRVSLGSESYDTIATNLQGRPAVAVVIYQRDGSNAITVSKAVNAALDELAPQFPPGVDQQLIVDEADFVRGSIQGTLDSLRDAVLLVFLVLLFGLGNSRLALITAAAVPVALIGSLSLLKLAGQSLNTLTLFGLVLASGLVVDDAIVVSEDIGRRLEAGKPPLQAAREAMAELGGAVVSTSIALVVVFIPVLSLGGSLGRLYAPIAITISGAIAFSTLNALSFTPVAGSRLLKPQQREPAWLLRWIDPPRRWLEGLEVPYGRWLAWTMERRRLVVSLLLAGLLITGFALQALPKAFIPQEDNGQLRGVVILADGLGLQQTQRVLDQVRQVVAEEPLITRANFYAGRSFGDSSPNKGNFFLRLAPIEQRRSSEASTRAVGERLKSKLRRRITGAVVQLSEAPSVRGFSSEGGLELELLDNSNGQLTLPDFEQQAQAFIRAAQATNLFERVSTRFTAGAPLVQLVPDRLQMASLGVDLSTVVDTLGASFGSDYVNDSFESDQVRKVIVQLDGASRRSADDVLALQVKTRDGQLISLAQLVRIEQNTGPTTINHTRLVRSISIRALPRPGVSSGQAMASLMEVQRQVGGGTELEWAGLAREESRAGGGNIRVFALAILVMVLVLAALYENFADPFIILVTVPLAMLGAVGGLMLRGLPLDVYGQMGLLMLVSLTAKNAILIVEFANQRMAEGLDLDTAISGAAIARLRPILLTALAALAGGIPLLFANGFGSGGRVSIGTVVFFGLLVSTFLGLFVVPVMYRIIKGWERGNPKAAGFPAP
ncbi:MULTISPECIES: efflux RND transporter permease subunit [Cyanobium]|uniref:RND transporter n=1 Tax=Cyanobium usitatum str. Tous TaxID=2116684 RepID=A0A2P7N1G9_9CYAN|nr:MULTISPECIES: efflux RND transporter permease subunit [Cyanobium]MCP9779949.1 efflux RND transporter permease subunit [Cyanobium sp. To12R1]PSJ07333.1 RND transporter [Cyanobium usitatum str. Tous]